MALYQTSVLKNYLNRQDEVIVNKAYKKYVKYFHNSTIQENIKKSKEEEYQGIFLTELFVNILGYTLNPMPNFNLVAEKKNQSNAQKADGAILKDKLVVAVIELKGTKTKDLESIRKQAFDYKANQKECVYVITSNYEKLRFYINDATEFEEFNLFTLTNKEFELLYLCLNKENILGNLPLKIKEESVTEEEKITKSFYADYSMFKRELYRDLVKQNGKDLKLIRNSELSSESHTSDQKELQQLEKNVKLSLFKKSQKLIDRFLFIFFAEDRDLLPPNSTIQILDKWKSDMEFGDERPLYNLFKQYFNYLDSGRKQMGKRAEIYAYNGGLFKPDVVLDSVKINDELLYKHTKALAKYDFESQVDVNILGHIFENSLNEIESVNSEIEGSDFDKQKSKRKKDGVFYTPKYITKYIVENTIGKLCIEKKEELGFKEEEYYKSRKGRQQATLENLIAILDSYREWLLKLTICDPACGSGAFLNQALVFLIKEHKYIDELKAKLLGGSLVLSDIENTILENNIYGVDLNEESVEIAKLSLWLRTAQPKRKLNDLSSNIKCGNSLIDSKEVAGNKAFNWQQEFPHIFEKGGFDVVIGNPPYVYARSIDNNTKTYFKEKYNCATYQIDLYILFLERAVSLINSSGLTSFIVPNTWLNNLLLAPVRKFFLNNVNFINFVTMSSTVFSDANVDTVITTFKIQSSSKDVELIKCINSEFVSSGKTSQLDWLKNEDFSINIHLTSESNNILQKMDEVSIKFGDIAEIIRGVGVYHKRIGHSKEFIESDPFQSTYRKDDSFVPYLRGRNLAQWEIDWSEDSFISYGNWLAEPREARFFENRRILIRKILSKGIVASFIEEQFVVDQQIYTAILNNKYANQEKQILAIICSKLMSFYFKNKYSEFDELFPQIKLTHVKSLPISNKKKMNKLDSCANSRFHLSDQIQKVSKKFQRNLEREFTLGSLPKKLQDWYLLSYGEFIKELEKKKVKLSLSQKAEWEDYFLQESKKALALKTNIDTTDKEIDLMVYELYGLTEEEIEIVEGLNNEL
jgi:tRNA1(Val) A37 N6-methylase TrmN6